MADKQSLVDQNSKSTLVAKSDAVGPAGGGGGGGANGGANGGGGGGAHNRKPSLIDRALDGIASVFEDKEAHDPDKDFAGLVSNARKLNGFIKTLHTQAEVYLTHIYAFYSTSHKFSSSMRQFYAENPDFDDELESLGGAATRWEGIYRSVYNEQLGVWRARLTNVVMPALIQHMTFFNALDRKVKERAALLKKKNHYHYKLSTLRLSDKPDAQRITRNTSKLAQVSRDFQTCHEEIASLLAGVWISRFSFIDPLLIEFVKLQALFNGSLSNNLTAVFNDVKLILGKRDAIKQQSGGNGGAGAGGNNAADPRKVSREQKFQQIMRSEQAVVKQSNAQREQKLLAQQQRAAVAGAPPIPPRPAAGALPGPGQAAQGGVKPGAWACGACTFQNEPHRERCEMCHGLRVRSDTPGAAPAAAPASAAPGSVKPGAAAPIAAPASGAARRPSELAGSPPAGMMNFKQLHAVAGAAAGGAQAPAGNGTSKSPASGNDSDAEEAELDKAAKEDDLATEVISPPISAAMGGGPGGLDSPGWDAKFAEPEISIDLNRSSAPALYKLLRKLGEGSYAPTYLAENVKDGRQYVIKKIPCASLTEANNALHEAVNLCLLRFCPNICSFQDVYLESTELPSSHGISGGGVQQPPSAAAGNKGKSDLGDDGKAMFRVCIVMEYCAGGDLRHQIEGAKELFPEEHILNWLLQICSGLKVIHTANLIHRDIKPANIFLDSAGGLRIGDFGVATILHRTQDLAMTHIGTPAYMAPEVLSRKPYDKKSDVWSMGCLAYEMVTLATPNFQFRTLAQVLGTVSEQYSPGLKRLMASMLQVDPNNRPSAADLLADIRSLMLPARSATLMMGVGAGGASKLQNPFAAFGNAHSDNKHRPGGAPGGGRSSAAPAQTPVLSGQPAAVPVPIPARGSVSAAAGGGGGGQYPMGVSSAGDSAQHQPPPQHALAGWNPLQTQNVSALASNLDRNLVLNGNAPTPLTAAQIAAMGGGGAGGAASPTLGGGLALGGGGSPVASYQTINPLSPHVMPSAISYDFAPRQSSAGGAVNTLKTAAGGGASSVASAAAPAAGARRSPVLAPTSNSSASSGLSGVMSPQTANNNPFAFNDPTPPAGAARPSAGYSPSNPFG